MTRMAGSAMSSLFGDMGSPDFSAIGSKAFGSAAQQGLAATNAGAKNRMMESNVDRIVEQAKMQAAGIRSAGAAQQQQQMGSMIGSTLSGIGGLFG